MASATRREAKRWACATTFALLRQYTDASQPYDAHGCNGDEGGTCASCDRERAALQDLQDEMARRGRLV